MNHFRVQCTLRVLLLAATLLAALLLLLRASSGFTALLVGLLAAYQLYRLIHYVEKTNRDLTRFLESIRYEDFSQTFTSDSRSGSFVGLGRAFRSVMDDFRAARAQREAQYRYLQTVMQHIGIGLISFRQDGSVDLINTAAKRLLRVRRLKNVKTLADTSQKLVDTLFRLRSGQKALVQMVEGDELLQLSISATEFKLYGERYTLVSIQDIGHELEEQEIASWQKLTRVLTHEIMNSITPISSMASTLGELLRHPNGTGDGGEQLDAEVLGDVREAVQTIERRSQSLLGFVQAYRSLTRVPTPEYQIFPMAELFENVRRLLAPQLAARGVQLQCAVEPEALTLTADPGLLERVLINLAKNAMEAVEGTPGGAVRLLGGLDAHGRTTIRVVDNGPGIVAEPLDKIFIPFYTTKKEGSGIGLSLSRQIMRQMGGTLSVRSEPGVETVFTLRF